MAKPGAFGTAGGFSRFFASARWALEVAWTGSASLLISAVAISFGRAMIPAGLALTARGLVNASLEVMQQENASIDPLLPWLALGFLLTLAEGLSGHADRWISLRLRDEVTTRLTADVLEHASSRNLEVFENTDAQDKFERAQRNPGEQVSTFVTSSLAFVRSSVQVVSLLGVLLFIEPLILLVVVLFALPYLFFQWRLVASQHALEFSRATKHRWNRYFVGMLTRHESIGEVKVLGLAPLLLERFRRLMREFRDEDGFLYRKAFRDGTIFSTLTTAAIYALFVRVALQVIRGDLTLGDLAIFGGAATRLRNGLESAVSSASGMIEQGLRLEDVQSFMQETRRAPTGNDLPKLEGRGGEIVFENVRFEYPGSRETVLQDLSFRIEPGETIAVVGENGAGKSTLVKLIACLYSPSSGRVVFDGQDLSTLQKESVFSSISFVFQEPARFEASAFENLAYGDWRSLLDDQSEVERLAKRAGVDDMIRGLPQGYATNLGRAFGDIDLSGGEWQKIAVARAFARDAALLIFDEPTSNLDAAAEFELFSRFQDLGRGRTTIIISHRFSTVSMADRIFVLSGGRIAESGAHQELMDENGIYARLFRLQRGFVTGE